MRYDIIMLIVIILINSQLIAIQIRKMNYQIVSLFVAILIIELMILEKLFEGYTL